MSLINRSRRVLLAWLVAFAPAFAAPPSGQLKAGSTPSAALHVPESVTLDYDVKAKAFGLPFDTTAQLIWQRDGERYHAEWNVKVPILGERRQRSEGAVVAGGLAPDLYVEQVKRERSAKFDYAAKRIHFSDDRPDGMLAPGTQDRLTVSLQLGILIAAAPGRYPKGSVITVPTAGVHNVEPWHWQVLGDETLAVGGNAVRCVKLKREPREAHDSQIELWLARPLEYLPARLRVTQKNGDVVDQRLSELPKPLKLH